MKNKNIDTIFFLIKLFFGILFVGIIYYLFYSFRHDFLQDMKSQNNNTNYFVGASLFAILGWYLLQYFHHSLKL